MLIITIGDLVPKMKNAAQQRVTFWMASAGLFICLVALNSILPSLPLYILYYFELVPYIFFAKYHLPAFRLHGLAGLLGRK